MPDDETTIGPAPVGPAPDSRAAADSAIQAETAEVPLESLPKYWQDEIRRKRQDEERYRTQLREVESRFEGIDPDEQAALAEFARLSKKAESGDEEAAAQLAELLGIEPEPEEQAPPQPQFDEAYFRRLAEEAAERIVSERDVTSRVEQIQSTARGWGFETTPGQPGYDRYQRLCYIATNEVDPTEAGGDLLGAAKTRLEAEDAAYKQQIISDYLAGKGMAADTGPLTPMGSGATPPAQIPRTWAEAREALHQRLEAG